MRYFIFISAFYLLHSTAIGWEIDWKFDRDLSCCLQEVHIQEHFVIKLETKEQSVGHMVVTIPGDIQIGVNLDDVEYFIPPNKLGLYALGPRPQKSIGSEGWDFTRYILLFKRRVTSRGNIEYEGLNLYGSKYPQYKLPGGKYKLQIKGLHDGDYKLGFYPNGTKDSDSALHWPRSNTARIKTGELHTFYFTINERGEIEFLEPEK